jgi:hypothetical protein
MKIEKRYDTVTMSRRVLYDVTDLARVEHPNCHTIKPETVVIMMVRDGEREPWCIHWVKLNGARILKDGTVGVSRAEHAYSDKSIVEDPHAPEWLVVLAADAAKAAEADRVGAHNPSA